MDKKKKVYYPPVVCVLGHVDHGKTTLLDAIRKTSVAEKEVGQITQKIGTSEITIPYEGEKRKITFIDTPGHEAFLTMRSRGVSAADIAILVVALNEGVKPQTKESIKHIKESKIPVIVALTKADLPDINQEKVKQQLVKEGILLEGLGGNVPALLVSGKTGKGIKELLDLILLVFEMQDDKKDKKEFKAVVIESKLDPKKGNLVTLVIKSGCLKVGDEIKARNSTGKVRAIFNSFGESLKEASVGSGIEILGFTSLPKPGEIVSLLGEEKIEEVFEKDFQVAKKESLLLLLLKADTLGSLEAISDLLPKEASIILKGTGPVNDSDILLAKAQKAIVLAFNVPVKKDILQLAHLERVIVKQYNLIYELLREIEEVVGDIKSGSGLKTETILGKIKILASFPAGKTKALGLKVLEGRIASGDRVKLLRRDTELGKSQIKSLRKGKEITKVAEIGEECGAVLDPLLDFEVGDMLLSYRV